MKNIRPLLVAALALGELSAAAHAGHVDAPLARELARSGSPQHVIVTLRDPAPRAAAIAGPRLVDHLKRVAARTQLPLRTMVEQNLATGEACRSLWIVNALCFSASPDLIRRLAARPDVDTVHLDEEVRLEATRVEPIPRRELAALDAALRAPGDTAEFTYGLINLRVPELRRVHELTGTGVKVGILDTGIDAAHPDLAGKVLAWKDFVGEQPEPYDDNGHGTHVAGTIAGGATSGLSIGVAPGARLVVAKIFGASGSASTEKILAAMQWIADPDGDSATADAPAICSNSWGGGPGRKIFLEATRNWVALGIFPSFAAGNSGPGSGTVGTPGGFLEAFAVGATDLGDGIASFSSRGPVTWDGQRFTKPDIAAPGKAVTSAKPGGGYVALSGTSMATPHISGVLALLHQAKPGITIDEARRLLESTAADLGEAGKDNDFGAGRADALAAAQAVLSGERLPNLLSDAGARAAARKLVLDAFTGGSEAAAVDRSPIEALDAAPAARLAVPREVRRALNARLLAPLAGGTRSMR